MEKYLITFRWYNTDTYCTNIVVASNEETAKQHYSQTYNVVGIRKCQDWEYNDFTKKGMPVVKL